MSTATTARDQSLPYEAPAPKSLGLWRAIALTWIAIGEGRNAQARYERLRALGHPHAVAAAQIFKS